MKIKNLALLIFLLPVGLFGGDLASTNDSDIKIKQLEIELVALQTDHDFRATLETKNQRLILANREYLDRVEAKIALINLELQRLRLISWEKPIDKP